MRGPHYKSQECKTNDHNHCDGFVPRDLYNDDKLSRRLVHAAQEDHDRIIRGWQENNGHDHPCECHCHLTMAQRLRLRAVDKINNARE